MLISVSTLCSLKNNLYITVNALVFEYNFKTCKTILLKAVFSREGFITKFYGNYFFFHNEHKGGGSEKLSFPKLNNKNLSRALAIRLEAPGETTFQWFPIEIRATRDVQLTLCTPYHLIIY